MRGNRESLQFSRSTATGRDRSHKEREEVSQHQRDYAAVAGVMLANEWAR